MVSDTINISKESRIVGEALATIAGFGDKFSQAE
jgi:hypothetical protein